MPLTLFLGMQREASLGQLVWSNWNFWAQGEILPQKLRWRVMEGDIQCLCLASASIYLTQASACVPNNMYVCTTEKVEGAGKENY